MNVIYNIRKICHLSCYRININVFLIERQVIRVLKLKLSIHFWEGIILYS